MAAQVTWAWHSPGSTSCWSMKEKQRGSPCPVQGTPCPTLLTSPKTLSHLLELFFFFFLTFLPDWNNGRPLCGQHNLRPQFFQASGKHQRHPQSLLLSMEHLIRHGHGLPGGQGQHRRPDGQGKCVNAPSQDWGVPGWKYRVAILPVR